jgi:NADPH:quinone reductase-like Zn-dependent oxidoreductase
VAKQTAKVVRFCAVGGPEVLKIEEEPIPEPGKGEVRLILKAIGLNRAEVTAKHFGHASGGDILVR